MDGQAIARAYTVGDLAGWNANLAREAFALVGGETNRFGSPIFKPLGIDVKSYAATKTMLYLACRKVLGKDTPNYPQQIGDCFPAGTRVSMADGSYKAIENVKVGEEVLSANVVSRRVLSTIAKKYSGKLVTINGLHADFVTATEDHRFIHPYNVPHTAWLPIGQFTKSDVLLRPCHAVRIVPVDAFVQGEADGLTVYCIEVEHDNSFIANGYAVSNCVSFGGKNAAEYLTCLDMAIRGVNEKWRPVFPPYYYGTSRVQIGGQHDTQDGSTGAWLAAAVVKYGTLFADETGVPAYSGSIAKKWGYNGPPAALIPTAQKYLVHSAALINSFDELVAALANGYPCTVAANVGYEMLPGSDGFHQRGSPWGHQMSFIGAGYSPEPYAIILNNWGDVHGSLKDFDDQTSLPVGVLRVRQKDAEAHIAAGETYAWSQFDGFPEQDIDKALFKVVGN